MNIGIVGFGFVGKAIYYGSNRQNITFSIYDIRQQPKTIPTTSIQDICSKCPIIFVCVPTPTNFHTHQVDTSIVEQVVQDINQYKGRNIVIIKSTVPPGTVAKLQDNNRNIILLFCPEFLREATYIEDYANQQYIVIGVPKIINQKHELYGKMRDVLNKFVYLSLSQNPSIIFTDSTTAELVKYTTNTFLATKVAFFNLIAQLCKQLNINYDILRQIVCMDERIGQSHTKVPGPDGKVGFGGKCFPKDLVGLIGCMDVNLGTDISHILKSTWEYNCRIRPEKDWLDIGGVSSDK